MKKKTIEDLPIDCSKLCCNFINTVFSWKTHDAYDFLEDYDHFIVWCHKLSVAGAEWLDRLRAFAKRHPAEAQAVMKEYRATRELLHTFISAIAKRDIVKIPKLLTSINPLLTEAWSNLNLDFDGTVFNTSYKRSPSKLKTPLWIIMKSLYDLLTGMDISRMKECPSCGWVFYDETKNGKRKWCNPLNCGTQDKMNRYHQRLRDQNA